VREDRFESSDLVVFPLSRYALEPLDRDALVLVYGGLTPRRIGAGTERLARAIHRVLRSRCDPAL
jgi:hypothetical protein